MTDPQEICLLCAHWRRLDEGEFARTDKESLMDANLEPEGPNSEFGFCPFCQYDTHVHSECMVTPRQFKASKP